MAIASCIIREGRQLDKPLFPRFSGDGLSDTRECYLLFALCLLLDHVLNTPARTSVQKRDSRVMFFTPASRAIDDAASPGCPFGQSDVSSVM